MNAPHWLPAQEAPALAEGSVHVWRATIPKDPGELAGVLSPDEWLESSRQVFEVDRLRYLATRRLLRMILAPYVPVSPADLRFMRSASGTLRLIAPGADVCFDVGYSDDLMLVAVARGREVGVDLEALRCDTAVEMLAEHYFEPEDAWQIRVLRAPERQRRFFEIWTRLEAVAQVLGRNCGLSRRGRPADCSVHSFVPGDGFAAALAVRGEALPLHYWTWQS